MKYLIVCLLFLSAPCLAQERVVIPAPPDFGNMTLDNSTTVFGPGEYQVGTEITRIGKGAVIKGSGMDKTRLVNTGFKVSAQGCAWEGNDALLEDICFESRVGKGEQSQVIGWQHNYGSGPPSKMHTTLRLNRFWGLGRTFGLYAWSARGDTTKPPNTVIAHDSTFEAGQFAVMAGGGSGPDAQVFYLYGCRIIVDFDRLIGAGGDQGLNACGVAAQGGRVIMYGGSIRVKGSAKSERAVGVWATKFPATPPAPKPDWPYKFPYLELHNVDCKVDGNGCPGPVFDAIGDVGPAILIVGGSGSGPNGSWLTSGNVTIK
jgi:hypothetical protein